MYIYTQKERCPAAAYGKREGPMSERGFGKKKDSNTLIFTPARDSDICICQIIIKCFVN